MNHAIETVPPGNAAVCVSLRGKLGWALFDWAAQPFSTLITTFIFAPYFVTGFIGDGVQGQAFWGYVQAFAGFLIALLSPILGAAADASGPRKPWILFFSLLYVCGACLLWLGLPGAPDTLTYIAVLGGLTLATLGAEFASVFNNAMLPDITGRDIGRWSGIGWGLGYVGGLVSLGAILAGFVLTPTPLFGLDRAMHEPDRFAGPFSAFWYVVFVLPLFLFTPDRAQRLAGLRSSFAEGLARLAASVRKARALRNVGRFLLARMIYQDGLTAIFAFGGIYAAVIFGWKIETLAVFGIVLSVFAATGAFLGGWLDDKIGSRRTILIFLVVLFVGTLLAVSVTADQILFGIKVPPMQSEEIFASRAEQIYLLAGILIGLAGGPIQSASRTLLARLSPSDMMGEFYGLFAFSGKATAFAAPFCIAVTTQAFVSQRAGLVVVLAFLLLGFLLFLGVREARASFS
jgi:UMF1 family MFS transporter